MQNIPVSSEDEMTAYIYASVTACSEMCEQLFFCENETTDSAVGVSRATCTASRHPTA